MFAGGPYMAGMPAMDDEMKALHWRAWHRGTREADLMIGGFFDAHQQSWGPRERAWFAELLNEQDVDIMAWAIGTAAPPARFHGPMMAAMQKLDYLKGPR